MITRFTNLGQVLGLFGFLALFAFLGLFTFLTMAGCASTGIDSVLMMPEQTVATADSTATPAPRRPAPMSTDSTNVLGQVLLMLPFSNSSDYRGPWPVYTGLPQILADSLHSNRFLRIVPVDSVRAFLTEDEAEGAIDPDRAAELARFMNADWAVIGDIDIMTMKRFQATVPLGGYRSFEGAVSANLILVNAIDGRPTHEVSAEGHEDSRRSGITNPAAYIPLDKQYALIDDIVWNSQEFHESLLGKAVALWAAQAASGVGDDIKPPPSLKVLEPKIIDVDGTVAYINIGLVDGIRNGDKYGVWDHGRELKDPDTGAILGQAPPRRVGVVQVEQIINDHLTQARIVDGAASIATGHLLRAE